MKSVKRLVGPGPGLEVLRNQVMTYVRDKVCFNVWDYTKMDIRGNEVTQQVWDQVMDKLDEDS